MCTEQNKNSDYKECETEFVKSFEYANSIMMKMLARKPARNLTSHEQLAALPYCKVGMRMRCQLIHDWSFMNACALQAKDWHTATIGIRKSGDCFSHRQMWSERQACMIMSYENGLLHQLLRLGAMLQQSPTSATQSWHNGSPSL